MFLKVKIVKYVVLIITVESLSKDTLEMSIPL